MSVTMASAETFGNFYTRDTVVVKRDGWIESKETGESIGFVRRDTNVAGQTLWRAAGQDISSWAWTRKDAALKVIELHNMQEKARWFDLMKGAGK